MTVHSVTSVLAAAMAGAFLGLNAAERPAPAHDFPWIEQRVRELQPAAHEKRFDEIGWAKDIRTAKKLARAYNRPVFLFTHDGRMNIGRC